MLASLNRSILVYLFVGCLLGSPLSADEEMSRNTQASPVLIVASAQWVEYTNSDYSGYYFDVIRHVFGEPEYTLDLRLVSYPGSVKMLSDGVADIILGVYDGDLKDALVSALPVELENLVVVLKPERARTWEGLSSLNGLKVGALEGYAFGGRLPAAVDYSEHKSQQGMLRMLKAGRLDAILEYRADILPVIKRYGHSFVLKGELPQDKIYFAFRKGERGRRLKAIFDQRYQILVETGEIWALMSASVTDAADSYPFVCEDKHCLIKGE